MALISTLTDSFLSLDGGKWATTTNTGGSVTVVSGELTLNQNWDSDSVSLPYPWTGVISVSGYEFAGSSIYCRSKKHVASSNGWMVQIVMGVINVTNDEGVGWLHDDTNLRAKIWNDLGDQWEVSVGSLTYSSTDHAWLRVREASDTFYWDTAPDSSGSPGSWTERFSYSKTGAGVSFDDMAAFLGTAGAKFTMRTYHFDAGLSAANITTNPKFDGVNTNVGGTTYNDASTEAATATHSQTTTVGAAAARTETATAAHVQVNTLDRVGLLTEAATATESSISSFAFAHGTTETAAMTDSSTYTHSINGDITETAAMTDTQELRGFWEKVDTTVTTVWTPITT
jgi:hypothetical protein